MQNFKLIFRYTGLSAIAATSMLTSCINDNSLCPAVSDEDDQMTLEFTVVTRDLSGHGTRALNLEGINELKGTVAENYLDLRNTVFLLFDSNQTLIKVFKPNVTPDIESGYAIYSVKAFISASEFETLTAGNTEGNLDFSIAVVGNFSRLTPQNAAYHIGQTLEEIFNQTTVATFEMPTHNGDYYAWVPMYQGSTYTDASNVTFTGLTEAYIPMAGIQTYNVPIARLEASTLQNPLNLSAAQDGSGDINMLRAIAKIEVVDRIDYGRDEAGVQPGRDNRTWIEKVELVGHTLRGSLFPTFGQWNLSNNIETQYVTTPSIPSTAGYVGATPASGTLTVTNGQALVDFFADSQATVSREDNCRVFSCYLTEINPNILTANDPRPWIRITAQGPTPDGTEPSDNDSMPYRLELAPYIGGNPGASMNILRNNIYRYEISGLSTWLDLHLVVDDWTKAETEWSYKANPALAEGGEINWNGAPLEVNTTTANVIATYGQDLTARFTFAEPEGGTWTAELVADQGDFRAFVFVDAEGNELVDAGGNPLTVSGPIDGKQSTIRIKPMLPAGTNSRSARLLFTVLTPDGRNLTANVLGNAYKTDKTYFTIYQNSSL